MRGVDQFVALAVLAIPLWSQQPIRTSTIDPTESCPTTDSDQKQSAKQVSVVEVRFPGPLILPESEQDELAASIRRMTIRGTEEGVVGQAEEMARRGWQNRGYFKVRVQGEAQTLTSNAILQRLALTMRVDEGKQYTLNNIRFTKNRAIANTQALRNLFPIADGDIFSREKIATGLENLRKAYGEFGYANETTVPITHFDEERSTISLDIDIDEGRQFYIGGIEILGLDDATKEQLLKERFIEVGQVYNARLVELFERKHASMFPECECRDPKHVRVVDESRGLAVLTFDARPCPASK